MVQIQVRLPEKDAKKEREETRKFWRMLRKRSKEAELPENLVPLKSITFFP